MEEKKRQKGEDTPLDYEELLNGFALEGDSNNTPASTHGDLDGLALAELLGDEELKPEALHASGTFDTIAAEDYSSLARQFEELELSVFIGEDPVQTESNPESAPPNEQELLELESSPADIAADPVEATADYAAILNSLELEELPVSFDDADLEQGLDVLSGKTPDSPPPAPSLSNVVDKSAQTGNPDESNLGPALSDLAIAPHSANGHHGLFDVVNLADTESFTEEDTAGTVQESGDSKTVSEAMPDEDAQEAEFLIQDMLSNVQPQTPVAGTTRIEPVVPEEEVSTAGVVEEDFLGLSSLAPIAGPSRRKDITAEILFEGVEMDFDRQVDAVTLAELYLAQGRKKEASALYRQVSKEKGVTHWVAKRLRMLTAGSEK